MEGRFQTTHWSLVLAARTGESEESRDALEKLCEAYWFPLYAFIRRKGYAAEEARDLTQGYFAKLLERRDLRQVRPELGRFRSFLLASVEHFLSNELDRERAKKRRPGGGWISLDIREAEDRYAMEPADTLTPESLFERKWAGTVLSRTFAKLEADWTAQERSDRIQALSGFIVGEETAASYREVGDALGMSENAVKAAVHRLRKRFGQFLREEISQTVRDPRDVDDEIRHLLGAVSG